MVEKFGTLAEFDFLYQKTGGNSDGRPSSVGGIPRGYTFVTYKTTESAKSAQRTLDGLEIAGRRLAVKWAHLQDQNKYLNTRKASSKPAPAVLSVKDSSGSSTLSSSNSISEQIASVEDALKSLDDGNNFSVAPDIGQDSKKPKFITYQFIERKSTRSEDSNSSRKYHHKPYSKQHRPHRR